MTATRPAGAGGTRRAAADRGDLDRPRALGLPARRDRRPHRRRDLGRDRRRPPARPRAARAARPPRRGIAASRSSPSRPRSCAAAPTTARTWSRPTTCCCATSTSPARSPRPGAALRRDADQQAAAPVAGGERSRPDRRRPLRRLERADAAGRRRSFVPTRPSWRPAGRRASRGSERGAPQRWLDAERAARRRSRPRSTAEEIYRAGAAPCPRSRPPRRRPRLHRLEHADPRPGGIPATERRRRALPLQPRRQRHRRPDLLRDRRRPRRADARPRSSPATSASSTTSAALPPCAMSRRPSASSSSTTAAAESSASCRRPRSSSATSSRPCSAPRAESMSAEAAELFALPHRRLDSLGDLGDAVAAGTGLIEVRTDRAENVELHRRLSVAVSEAVSG